VLGFAFLTMTFWSFVMAPGTATAVLTVFGLCWGFGFLGVPWFDSPEMRNVFGSITFAAIMVGFAALVHFLLIFPDRRPFMERRSAGALIYWPAILVAIVTLGFNVFQPLATSGINLFFRFFTGAVQVGYFGAALVTMFRRYSSASVDGRARHGLNLMMAGAVLGVFPLLLQTLVALLAPASYLPGAQFYFLALGLIPVTFSLAAVKSARA